MSTHANRVAALLAVKREFTVPVVRLIEILEATRCGLRAGLAADICGAMWALANVSRTEVGEAQKALTTVLGISLIPVWNDAHNRTREEIVGAVTWVIDALEELRAREP